MKHIIIGDVHGVIKEFNALIDKLSPSSDDTIVFVGDLLDKGPDSAGVVRRVRELSNNHNVVLVMGNHEDTHSRYRTHLSKQSKTALTMSETKPELPSITQQLSEDDIAFLDTAVPFYRVPDQDILVVHAGIPGNMPDFPQTVEDAAALTGKKKKLFKLIMRTRFVSAETGKFLGLGDETPADPFWADVYDGRFGHVVFGHQPFIDGVKTFDHATGIDTAAVFGGDLTALVIDGQSRSYVSVPSDKYADMLDC